MAKMPFITFFVHDWLYDTRICTDSEKAVLIDLLCFMHNAPERGILTGHPQDLARMVGKEWGEFRAIVTSLVSKKVLDLTEPNGNLTLISRRMVRDENIRESNRKRQEDHYSKQKKRKPNGNITDKKSEVRSHKSYKDLSPLPPSEIPADLIESKTTIMDWLEYKRQRAQTYKPKGLEALWRTFRAIPASDRRDCVDQSMANNWAGLFYKPGGNNGQTQIRGNVAAIGKPDDPDSKWAGVVKVVHLPDPEPRAS